MFPPPASAARVLIEASRSSKRSAATIWMSPALLNESDSARIASWLFVTPTSFAAMRTLPGSPPRSEVEVALIWPPSRIASRPARD